MIVVQFSILRLLLRHLLSCSFSASFFILFSCMIVVQFSRVGIFFGTTWGFLQSAEFFDKYDFLNFWNVSVKLVKMLTLLALEVGSSALHLSLSVSTADSSVDFTFFTFIFRMEFFFLSFSIFPSCLRCFLFFFAIFIPKLRCFFLIESSPSSVLSSSCCEGLVSPSFVTSSSPLLVMFQSRLLDRSLDRSSFPALVATSHSSCRGEQSALANLTRRPPLTSAATTSPPSAG